MNKVNLMDVDKFTDNLEGLDEFVPKKNSFPKAENSN